MTTVSYILLIIIAILILAAMFPARLKRPRPIKIRKEKES